MTTFMIPHLSKLSHQPIQMVRLIGSGTRNSRREGNRVAMPACIPRSLKQHLNEPHLVERHLKSRANGPHPLPHVVLQSLNYLALGSPSPGYRLDIENRFLEKFSAPCVLLIADPLHIRSIFRFSVPSEACDALIVAVYNLR